MGRNKSNLMGAEALAEEVRKYSIIYDKSNPSHKDKFKIKNAWRKVEEALGMEEGIIPLYKI